MSNILDKIVETKRQEVAIAKQRRPLEHLVEQANAVERPRNFYQAIAQPPAHGLHLIAEIKKASPSAGLIRQDFDPVEIARIYHVAGASAISVLTDQTYFQGDLGYIRQVKQAVPLPVLRKDFMVDPYQVYEARAAGADAILLIAEVLPPGEMLDMLILANELNLTSLIEVHTADRLMQVRSAVGFPHRRYSLLGINNRDLKVQKVDVTNTLRLLDMVEDDELIVSESGIKTRADVTRLMDAGVRAILVGETIMRSEDMAAKIAELLGK